MALPCPPFHFMIYMIINLFSKRQKKARGEVPDVYQYSEIPGPLRIQIVHIITAATNIDKYSHSAFGSMPHGAHEAFETIVKALRHEYGVFKLCGREKDASAEVINFFLTEQDIEKALDVVELCFRWINTSIRNNPYQYLNPSQSPDEAIDELNNRFKEHGVGYQFEQASIIRIDSELLHAEVVRPLLAAMTAKPFVPALSEFQSAHEHYRHKRYKECLNDCLKAFESTMKAVCAKRGWPVDPKATASPLVQALFDNQFFPAYLQTQMSALRTLLESGTPTIRNKNSGHGQGTSIIEVPESLASYCIHMTATNLLFIVARA
jgi:hypothetical protein